MTNCRLWRQMHDTHITNGTNTQGPWRPPSSIQRGSVFTGEGDPLTPMYPATHDGFRLTMREGRDKATVGNSACGGVHLQHLHHSSPPATVCPTDAGWALPTIPSLPIGYGDAEPLLRSLSGAGPAVSTLDSSWQGGLDFDYYVGPGTAQRVCVALAFPSLTTTAPCLTSQRHRPSTGPAQGGQHVCSQDDLECDRHHPRPSGARPLGCHWEPS